MTTYVVATDTDRSTVLTALKRWPLPFTVNITKGKHRTNEQNHLAFLWYGEIADQLGDQTPEEVRGFCKLTFGVPILRAENEGFREKYDRYVRPLSYEARLAIMQEPLDMPVTRLMSTHQKTRYLDAMSRFFLQQGVALTEPRRD